MKGMRSWVRSMTVLGVTLAGLESGIGGVQAAMQTRVPITAQTTTQTTPGTIPGATQSGNPLDRGKEAERSPFGDPQEKQAKQRNDDRQRRLVSDTEKLLALATSLHEDVAKTNKNVLSLDVVRRADEIERLAHSVKERMKG